MPLNRVNPAESLIPPELTIDILKELITEEKYSWNNNLIVCSKRNDAVMAKYCIDRCADNYIYAMWIAIEDKAYDVIKLLISLCAKDIDFHFSIACCSSLHKCIILLLDTYDTIDLTRLKKIDVNADVIISIIMTRPFELTRNHFHLTNDICNELNNYNKRIQHEIQSFMCRDTASIVLSYVCI